MSDIVIVGAGHAGGCAAAALRAAGFGGSIALIGEESHPPYERPPLSKELLAGTIPVERTYLKPLDFYRQSGIELRRETRVTAIDRAGHSLTLSDGTAIGYGLLLLTTGARARRLAVPGADDAAVFYIRDIADSLALRAVLGSGRRLVVIGAGFIGLEAASVARRLGAEVTVIEIAPTVLARVAPPELAAYYRALHEKNGVALMTGERVTEIDRRRDGTTVVVTASGQAVAADAVLVGIGAIPNTELAGAAGLALEDGVVVDAFGRTSDPAIFAAGDVTRHFNPLLGRSLRLEAWQNAQNQAIAIAKVMAGGSAPYTELPWFWSDQYDVNLQTAGVPETWDAVIWRGRAEDGRFTLFYLSAGVPVGGATVNNARDMRFLKQLITKGQPVDPARLADPGVKLADLVAG